jgi:hypothetical protein
MAPLISYDENGEAWFDNPHLILANPRRARRNGPYDDFASGDAPPMGSTYDVTPRAWESPRKALARLTRLAKSRLRKRMAKKGRTMARQGSLFGSTSKRKKARKGRNRKGQFTKRAARARGRSTARTRRARAAAHPMFVVRTRGRKRAVRGRARRRAVQIRINPRRRRFHSNPFSGGGEIRLPFGLALPPLSDVAFAGAGLVVPPMISTRIQAMLPASITQAAPTVVPWVVDLASVVVPGMLLKRFVSQRAGNAFLIGGAATMVLKAIKVFAPSTAASFGLSGYMSGQPGLGRYFTPTAVSQPQTRPLPAIIGTVPDRLMPSMRF